MFTIRQNRSIKILFSIVCLVTSSAYAISQQDLPPPYDTAEILPFFQHGWYRNAAPIESLIKQHNIKTIIEVGSWLGTSTRHMASCLPDEGIVYAVDHWIGSSENQPGQKHWIPELEHLYEYFLSNAIHANLAHKIVPVRMGSLEAAEQLQVQADLIYIDASHDAESVYKDLVAWYPHVKKDGVFCGDDWDFPSVKQGVISFATKNRLRISGLGTFWMVEKR